MGIPSCGPRRAAARLFPGVLALLLCAAGDPETSLPIAGATRVDVAPSLDGVVATDSAYSAATVITGFRQTSPDEGLPASQRTEVRIVYTEQALYIGVICWDDRPKEIIGSDSRRDGDLDETDSFRILLDTFDDDQNAFVFGTNPAGAEYDAQIDNDGQGNTARAGQGSGAVGGININWDGSWSVKTFVGEFGWSAEFAIPFKTLRFASTNKEQVWGLNLQRNIRRRNETSFWAPLPRQFDLHRVSFAGSLTGLVIHPPRNLKLSPYALAQARRTVDSDPKNSRSGEVGADLKYSLTPSLTLDLTYNTDFAQVEVDQQQVNLDRFNLFFPEKRPFFLENAGHFTVGAPGEVEMFFSRRIGIGPGGRVIPILGGGRLSGKVGHTNLGLLNMQTESVEGVTGANNYTVARVQHELPNRSAVGFMFNNRESVGEGPTSEAYNRLVAVDGKWGIGRYGETSGFVARTFTPGSEGSEYAFKVFSRYESERWTLEAGYSEVTDDFNPEIGFLLRDDYRKVEGRIQRQIRKYRFLGIKELRPHTSYRAYWNFDGLRETSFWHIDNHWEWRSGWEAHTGINLTSEGVEVPFTISPGVVVPAGTYDHVEAQLVLWTNQGAPISLNNRANIGGFFGGRRFSLTSTLVVRMSDRFTTEATLQRNDVSLPWGDFTANLLFARLSYTFTPRLFVQGLFQSNSVADLRSANIRLGWLQAANTGLFLVYNETVASEFLSSRSLTVKYSRVLDVLR